MTEVIWAKGFGATDLDQGYSIATDSSGNVYTTGIFEGSVTFGTTTLTSKGERDIFVAKQDSSGNVAWAKSFGGTNDDYGKSIVIDNSGNIYATGFISGLGSATFGTTNLTSNGLDDMFVTKLDSKGDVVWAKNFGSTQDDGGTCIATDSNGNLYTAGYFQNKATFGTTTLTSQNSTNEIFVAKHDSSGNVLWAKGFGGTGLDNVTSISSDGNGNTYITGSFTQSISFGNTTLTSKGNTDFFVTKLDSKGDVVWAKSFGNQTPDVATSITTDSSNNIYITGGFSGSLTLAGSGSPYGSATLTSKGKSDIFFAKLDSNGLVIWAGNVGGSGNDAGTGITINSSGNLYLTGSFADTVTFGTNKLTSQGTSDIFVANFDTSFLNFVSAIGMGGSGADQGRAITTDNNGNIYTTGSFSNIAPFGTKLLASKGSQDIYVAKLSLLPTVSLGQTKISQEQGHINGTFTINLDTPAPRGGLTVNYNIGGTATRPADYNLAKGNGITAVTANSFTIAAGQTTATLNVVPVDDTVVEPTEAVELTLTSGSNYKLDTSKSGAIVPIIDDDIAVPPTLTPTISILPGINPSETNSSNGTFLISLDSPAPPGGLTINYTTAGTATKTTDYTLATGNNIAAITPTSFTIAAGQTTATINVNPFDDNIVDPNETIQLTLSNGTGYTVSGTNNNATLTIADNDVTPPVTPNLPTLPTITIAPGTNPSERGTIDGTFFVTLDNPAPAGGLTINYTVAGTATRTTDYTIARGDKIANLTTNSFTIADGETKATLNVTPVDDGVRDPGETVQLTLNAGTNYNVGTAKNATLTIADDVRTVTIAPGTNANERGSNNGTFIITLDSPAPAGGLTIDYKLGGTATETTDFSLTPGTNITSVSAKTFTIAAGQTTATINVSPVDDTVFDPNETVQLTLERGASNYTLGATTQATVTIADNTPTVNISSQGFAAERGLTNGTFVITLDNPAPAGGLTMTYALAGTATQNTDYNLTTGNNITNLTATSLTIAAGQTTATLNVVPLTDAIFDPNENVQLTLNSGNGYNLGTAIASVAIADQEDCFCEYITAPNIDNFPGLITDLNPFDHLLDGDADPNFLVGWFRNDEIFGFAGDDFILGEEGNDNLVGGIGNDEVYGSTEEDWVAGGEGDDFLNGNESQDYVNGNEGNDTLRGGQDTDLVRGGQANDIIYGDKDNDILAGDKGDDTVFGCGTDNLSGSTDDDFIFGGSGNDLLFGNTGIDFIFAEDGNDTVFGGQDQDFIFGEAGDDLVFGDRGNDLICGDEGNDTLYGGNGIDLSDPDIDEICGGKGDDLIFGNLGKDWLSGDSGNDSIYGGKGDDTIIGGDDNDFISGDLGNDFLSGGDGSDRFVLASGKSGDVILDFQDGVDFIALSGGLTFQQLVFTQSGNNTVITQLGSNELLATLNGVAVNLITQTDFTSLP